MKKSIRWHIISLVVFATVTAFTTKPKKTTWLGAYAVWGIHPRQVWNSYFDPVDVGDLNSGLSEVLYFGFSPISYSGYSSLEEFREEYDDGELVCDPYGGHYVCMAYVAYDLGFLLNGQVLDIIEGDYEHIYW